MEKTRILSHLRSLIEEKIRFAEENIRSTIAARDSDGKSTAGDKHEVGRAMIQIELEKQESQLAKLRLLEVDLSRVPMDRTFEEVGFGSLVTTDQGRYFISIGLGAMNVEGETVYAISLQSPVGQALKDKRVADEVVFGGKRMRVLGVG